MARYAWVNDRVGRNLVIGFCSYEVVALTARSRHLPTLTCLNRRACQHRYARFLAWGLFGWLVHHLFFER